MNRKQRRLNKMENTKSKIKSIIRAFIILFILSIIFYMIYGWYKESKIKIVKNIETELTKLEKQDNTENIMKIILEDENQSNAENGRKTNESNSQQNKENQLEEPVPNEYLGYKVSAMLEIPKLNISSNVLEEYSKEGLEVCISKFWGSNPNEIGNYCIAGHNYARKNMFGYLGDLEIGDRIYLSDNKNGKFSYTIYDKYRIEADDTSSLSQNTDRREITLITCTSYSNKRLIIKAVEDI